MPQATSQYVALAAELFAARTDLELEGDGDDTVQEWKEAEARWYAQLAEAFEVGLNGYFECHWDRVDDLLQVNALETNAAS
eukprot:SAG31_NODE_23397_length_505_cov_1.012315_2_plen_80_part_01